MFKLLLVGLVLALASPAQRLHSSIIIPAQPHASDTTSLVQTGAMAVTSSESQAGSVSFSHPLGPFTMKYSIGGSAKLTGGNELDMALTIGVGAGLSPPGVSLGLNLKGTIAISAKVEKAAFVSGQDPKPMDLAIKAAMILIRRLIAYCRDLPTGMTKEEVFKVIEQIRAKIGALGTFYKGAKGKDPVTLKHEKKGTFQKTETYTYQLTDNGIKTLNEMNKAFFTKVVELCDARKDKKRVCDVFGEGIAWNAFLAVFLPLTTTSFFGMDQIDCDKYKKTDGKAKPETFFSYVLCTIGTDRNTIQKMFGGDYLKLSDINKATQFVEAVYGEDLQEKIDILTRQAVIYDTLGSGLQAAMKQGAIKSKLKEAVGGAMRQGKELATNVAKKVSSSLPSKTSKPAPKKTSKPAPKKNSKLANSPYRASKSKSTSKGGQRRGRRGSSLIEDKALSDTLIKVPTFKKMREDFFVPTLLLAFFGDVNVLNEHLMALDSKREDGLYTFTKAKFGVEISGNIDINMGTDSITGKDLYGKLNIKLYNGHTFEKEAGQSFWRSGWVLGASLGYSKGGSVTVNRAVKLPKAKLKWHASKGVEVVQNEITISVKVGFRIAVPANIQKVMDQEPVYTLIKDFFFKVLLGEKLNCQNLIDLLKSKGNPGAGFEVEAKSEPKVDALEKAKRVAADVIEYIKGMFDPMSGTFTAWAKKMIKKEVYLKGLKEALGYVLGKEGAKANSILTSDIASLQTVDEKTKKKTGESKKWGLDIELQWVAGAPMKVASVNMAYTGSQKIEIFGQEASIDQGTDDGMKCGV